MCSLCWLTVRWQECGSDFPQFSCWPLKSIRVSLFLKISLLKFPTWTEMASSWLIWISKETRRSASLGFMSLLRLECRRCPYGQPWVCQIPVWGNIYPESFSTGCVIDRQVVVFEMVWKIILETFQISSYPPKKITTPILGDSKGDLLFVIPGVVTMGLSYAAQFQSLKIPWKMLWRHSFVSLQE